MKISSILRLAYALAGASAIATSAQSTCTSPQDGKICLSNCKGAGFFVTAPQLINGIELGPTFQLDFDPATGAAKASSKGVKVGLSLPESLKKVDLDFSGAKARIQVGAPGGPMVGLLNLPDFVAANGTSLGGNVQLDMDQVSFSALNDAGFQELFRTITLASGPIQLELQGHAGNSAKVRNAGEASAGDDPAVCLEYVGFTAGSQLIGLNGLKEATIMGLPKIVGGSPATGIELLIDLKVINPSNVILNLKSDVVLDLVFKGEKCGTVVLPNMSLALGENNFAAKSFIFPDKSNIKALIATKDLMSRFTGNTESDVLVNNGRAAKAPVLNAALGAVSISQKLPANKELLIKKSTANVSSLSYSSKADSSIEMMANIGAFNPFDTPVSITNIQSTLSYKGKDCIAANVKVDNFKLPAKGEGVSPQFKVKLDGKVDPFVCGAELVILTLGKRDVKVDVKSTLTLDIGGYPSVIDYNQPNVAVESTSSPCSGSEPGSYCLGDCKEDGLKLPMPLPLIENIVLPNFKLEFDPINSPLVPKATATDVSVKLGVPEWLSYINFAFSGAGASIAIGAPGGPLIAQIDTPDYETATGSIKEGTVGLNIVEKDFKALSKEGMEQLLKFITLNSGPTPVRMKGVANNKAKFPAPFDRGDVCLRYINFDIVSTSLIGLGGLRDTVITDIPKITSANPTKGIELEVPLAITNPSNIVLHANADITMDFVFDQQKLGTVVLEKFRLEKGVNNLKAKAFVHPDPTNVPQLLATKKMFSQFTGGVVSDVTVGNGKAEGLELLDAALQAVSIPQKLPANQDKLIIDAVANGLTLDYPATYPDTGLPNDLGLFATLEASLTAYNPFHVPVTIVKVTGKLYYKGIACLLIDTPVKGFTIPPRSSIVSPPILTGFDNREDPRDDSLCNEFLGKQLSGEKSLLELRNTLTIVIDKGYLSQIDYVQKDVSVSTSF